MKFIDEINLKVVAGKGGNGIVSFRREAHVDKGGPDGGSGGKGGDVYFVGDPGQNNLFKIFQLRKIQGNDGQNGRRKNQNGKNGADLFVKVPLGTLVFDSENRLICDILTKKNYLIAKGGRGGFGNSKFKSSRNLAPRIYENGDLGQTFNLKLVLKFIADVGLVGKPNAGKSSLLASISNSKTKIGNYQFTTLTPQLGKINFENHQFVVADLPGLIKNANLGKGLGFQFLKHIERAKIICHVIDFGSENATPIEDFITVSKEIYGFNAALKSRAQIVVATKSDLPNFTQNVQKFNQKFSDISLVQVSILDDLSLKKLCQKMVNSLAQVQEIEVAEQETEINISLAREVIVEKKFASFFEISGSKVAYLYNKIPLTSQENLNRFNFKLKKLGIWDQLEKMGIQKGDTIRIFSYEFSWIDEN